MAKQEKNKNLLKCHTAVEFSQRIEKDVREKKLGYLEAIIDYCKEVGLELESVPRLLTQSVKASLEEEALNLNMLKKKKKRTTLPFV